VVELDLLESACKRYVRNNMSREQTLTVLAAVEAVMGSLREQFEQELPFQEQTPLLAEQSARVRHSYAELGRAKQALQSAIDRADSDGIEDEMAALRSSIKSILDAMDKLREEAAARDHYSDAPHVNELCRVAQAALDERLPETRFRERLTAFKKHHDAFLEQLAATLPDVREESTFERLQPQLEAAFEEQSAALDELEQYFVDHEAVHILDGVEKLCLASEQILAVQKELRAACTDIGDVHCMRCGAVNTRTVKYCTRCNAILPQVAMGAPMSSLEVHVGESDEAGGRKLTANMQKLADLSQAVLNGVESPTALSQLAAQMLEQVAQVQTALDTMEQTAGGAGFEEKVALFTQAHQTFADGLMAMALPLSSLRTAADAGDAAGIEQATTAVLAAGDQILGVEAYWNRFSQLAQQGG
jgi:hypothetical protein